jgi:ribose transport system substrate-binding protein
MSGFGLLRTCLALGALWLAAALPAAAGEPGEAVGVVAFAQDDLGNDWRRAQVAAVRRELADESGVRFRVTDARGNPAVQVLHIQRLLREDVDVLITSPADSQLLEPVLRRAREADVPVILLSRRTPSPVFTSYIHPDNRRITRKLAEFLLGRLQGEGRVLMLRGVPGVSTTRQRTETFLEMAARYPRVSVDSRTANYLRADAIQAVEAVLRRHDGFPYDAIYAQSDSMASGARMALRQAGIDPGSLLIAGIDYIAEARRAIRRGEQTVSYTYPTGGAQGAAMALRLLRGQPVPREMVIESQQVTADNVARVTPIF